MAVRTRIDPIERDIELIFAEELSPAARSRKLARASEEAFRDAQAINQRVLGRMPDHETFVDGVRTDVVDRVKPDGVIIHEFDVMDDLLGYIDLQLITHSPAKSGRFRKSHVLLADGELVDPSEPRREGVSRYVYLNTQPYARKIERGRSKQAPDGVFRVVAAIAARRFGNIASIKFSYETPLFGAVDSWAGKTSMVRADRPNMKGETRAEWLRRQPAIVVTYR